MFTIRQNPQDGNFDLYRNGRMVDSEFPNFEAAQGAIVEEQEEREFNLSSTEKRNLVIFGVVLVLVLVLAFAPTSWF